MSVDFTLLRLKPLFVLAISSTNLILSGGSLDRLDRRKRRKTSFTATSTATTTATTTTTTTKTTVMTQSPTSCTKSKHKTFKIPHNSTTTIASKLNKSSIQDIIHDPTRCMFKAILDTKGNCAALCYLPTRYKNIVEFYHIEIPSAYRNQGLGDLLLSKAFEWVQEKSMSVIPTCPFVLKYLEARFPDQKSGHWPNVLASE
ncbi:hypothetical protein MFLAVUS_000837 [Mucor flavus]|uniref:N-acetyltransferase domain-containing protein n=1 Tax=Mucor flavus TaxID=439312 RepID=A0ABP9YKT4_9FUNG